MRNIDNKSIMRLLSIIYEIKLFITNKFTKIISKIIIIDNFILLYLKHHECFFVHDVRKDDYLHSEIPCKINCHSLQKIKTRKRNRKNKTNPHKRGTIPIFPTLFFSFIFLPTLTTAYNCASNHPLFVNGIFLFFYISFSHTHTHK